MINPPARNRDYAWDTDVKALGGGLFSVLPVLLRAIYNPIILIIQLLLRGDSTQGLLIMGLHYEEGQAADVPERSIGAAGPGLHDHEAWAPQRHVGMVLV